MMNINQKISLFLLRISIGWLFFYAGITKVLDPSWTAKGYLMGAKTFPELFNFFLKPDILPIVNFLNQWGLLLIGVALILGVFMRTATVAGISLMILYYLPILNFPYPNTHSYIVDEHIIYALVLVVLLASGAGRAWGLQRRF
jgi:thiosulfate dehydrogenase [quinone] large subunit